MYKYILIPLIFLSGCDNKPKEEQYRTIGFFDKNIETRDKRIKECATLEKMSMNIAKDCDNARKSATLGKLPDTSNW